MRAELSWRQRILLSFHFFLRSPECNVPKPAATERTNGAATVAGRERGEKSGVPVGGSPKARVLRIAVPTATGTRSLERGLAE